MTPEKEGIASLVVSDAWCCFSDGVTKFPGGMRGNCGVEWLLGGGDVMVELVV